MATIDDFGNTTDPLGLPALGGPTGWAAAVRDFITGLPGDIAAVASDLGALATTVSEKVSKAGDTMTGALALHGNPTLPLEAAPKQYVDEEVTVAHAAPTGTPSRDGLLWVVVP